VGEAVLKETWKVIPGTSGCYSVSCFGRIRREKSGPKTYIGKILKPSVDKDLYHDYKVSVKSRTFHLKGHQVVAEAFIGPCPRGKEVNHKDGVKSNNYFRNLEYKTHVENCRHAASTGLLPRGSLKAHSKLFERDVLRIRRLVANGSAQQKDLAELYGVTRAAISSICLRKSWRHI
jgi:hypothetical protein